MRAGLTSALAATAIGLCTASLSAAPLTGADAPNATPLTRLAQGFYDGGQYPGTYRPACAYRFHYSCWHDPYGVWVCGCRRDFGLFGLY
jgi:hypothetical protein